MFHVPTRYLLMLGTFLLSMLLYVDRVCISAAKEAVAADLGLSDTQMGWIISSFALGYALFQTPSGMLADRYGPRAVLTAVVSFWSLFTGLTGLAWNYLSMLIFRFAFGLGEAGAYPGCARAIYAWIPMSERGIMQGVNFSGGRLGAAFALPAVAAMIASLGWRVTFGTLAAAGFVWAIVWYAWFRDDPRGHSRISEHERAYILATRQQVASGNVAARGLRPADLLVAPGMWLAMGQYFCSNFTFFFCLSWLFPHLKARYGLTAIEAGLYTSCTMVFAAVGNWVAGFSIDAIYRSGRWSLSRQLPAIVGFVLGAAGLLMSVRMETVTGAVIWLSIATFGCDMTISPSWSFCIDIGGSSAGAVSGTMNMAGNLGSFVTGLAFPYLLKWTGSETLFFYVGAGLNLVAILMWLGMRSDRPIEPRRAMRM